MNSLQVSSNYLNSKKHRVKIVKKKSFQRCWKCLWCGNVLQITTHRYEKKNKDFCNVYCTRPYYDFMKRLSLRLEKSSLALFTEELDDKRNEILDDLTKRVRADELNKIFMDYTKIIRKKIKKDKVLEKRLIAKRFLVLNNSTIEDI